MRQVRIRVTCDACAAWHEADTEEGVQTVPVAGGQTLDLCPSHRTDLAPMLALIAEWGAAPDSVGRRRATTPVVATSAPEAPARNGNAPSKRGGKRARQRRANAEQAPASDVALPLACPLCEQVTPTSSAMGEHLRRVHSMVAGAVYGGTCPLCAHEGDPRGLGTHANKAHGVHGVPALFAMARSQDDPHGVLASRAAALAGAQ